MRTLYRTLAAGKAELPFQAPDILQYIIGERLCINNSITVELMLVSRWSMNPQLQSFQGQVTMQPISSKLLCINNSIMMGNVPSKSIKSQVVASNTEDGVRLSV